MLSVFCSVCSSRTVSESSEVIVGAEDGGPEGALSCDGACSADCEAMLALALLAAVDGTAGSVHDGIPLLSESSLGVRFGSCLQRTSLWYDDVC